MLFFKLILRTIYIILPKMFCLWSLNYLLKFLAQEYLYKLVNQLAMVYFEKSTINLGYDKRQVSDLFSLKSVFLLLTVCIHEHLYIKRTFNIVFAPPTSLRPELTTSSWSTVLKSTTRDISLLKSLVRLGCIVVIFRCSEESTNFVVDIAFY